MKKFLAILTVLTLLCSMMTFGVSAEDVVTITAENFATEFSAEKATSAKVYKLDDDITVSPQKDSNYFQIFEGSTFDGCGHKITIDRTTINGLFTIGQDDDTTTNQKTIFKNIDIGSADTPQQVGYGVFLNVDDNSANSTVDVTWENINVYVTFSTNTNNAGAFVSGNAWGTLTFNNCYVNATAVGNGVGAFIGRNKAATATFNGCVVDGSVTAVQNAGGFIGKIGADDQNPVTIFNNCVNNASVKNTATSSAKTYGVGGFVGSLSAYKQPDNNVMDKFALQVTFKNCVNNGNISCDSDTLTGGFVGYSNGGGNGYIYIEDVTFEHCVNYGDIGGDKKADQSAGFIVGDANFKATLTNCLNAGDIYAKNHAAGFVRRTNNVNINNCITIGALDGGSSKISTVQKPNDSTAANYVINNTFAFGNGATDFAGGAITGTGNKYFGTATNAGTDAAAVDANKAIELLKASAFKYLNFTNDNGTIKVSTVDNGLVGAQLGSNDTAVRILGVVDSLDYAGVGFKVSVTNDGNTILAETEFYCTTVYSSVIADGETIHSSQLGGTYIVALTLNDIQTNDIITVSALTGNTPTTYFTYNGSELVASVG